MAEAGRFRNVAEGEIADAGWAWGAQFGDFNNDGANELFVVNGFISGDREKSYWYAMSKIAGANARFFEDAATWPPFGTQSLSGYERSRVYLNRGVAGWVDVAATVGVTDRVRRARGGARRSLESRRGRCDRREPEPAGAAVSQLVPIARTTGSASRSSARAATAARSAPRWCSSREISCSGGSSMADRDSRARTTGACTSGSGLASGWIASSSTGPRGRGRCCRARPIDRFVTVTEPRR